MAEGVAQRCVAVGKLAANFGVAFESQQGMGEGVVADDVAGFDDLAGNFGTLLDVASDQEECCVHAVLRENFEQAQRVRIVGAVVVGEGELFRSSSQAGEGAAVPLSGGRHGLVARGDGGGQRGSSGQG